MPGDINETLADMNVFIYSPVIESGVDITVKIKKVFGVLSCKSNCQRAFLQMVNRCRCVEEPRMDFLNDRSFKINNNYNLWKYSEVMELDRQTVQNTRLEVMVSEGELSVSENDRNSRRKQISVFNTVEKLNKHPSLYINYLRVLVLGKGMTFTIQGVPAKEGETSGEATKPKNYKISAILEAKDLTAEEYEEIAARKKAGKTTTQENFRAEKHFWQRFFLTTELDEKILKEFMFDCNPLYNFLSLVDLRNHRAQDNLKSDHHLERVRLVAALLERLGWEHVLDASCLKKEDVRTSFMKNVVQDPLFRNQKRLNQLFGLYKGCNISTDMSPQQVLMWCNSLLKQFSVQVRAEKHGGYFLELQNDLLSLIKRKNNAGRYYEDSRNLLKQESKEGDPFIDEETGETLIQKRERAQVDRMRAYDTSLLDRGLDFDLF